MVQHMATIVEEADELTQAALQSLLWGVQPLPLQSEQSQLMAETKRA